MAKLLSIRLEGVNFKSAYCSDLKRAVQSMKIIMENEYFTNNSINVDFSSQLREKNCGVFEGKSISTMREAILNSKTNIREFKPNGGESWFDVFIRAKTFLNDLIKEYVKKDFVDPSLTDSTYYLSNLVKTFEKKLTFNYDKGVIKSNNLKPHRTSTFKKENVQDNGKERFQRDVTISKGLVEDSMMIENHKSNEGNIIQIKKQPQAYTLKEVKYEYQNLVRPIEDLMIDKESLTAIQRKYYGFNLNNILPRILIMSHSGFILEFMNVIRQRKNVSPKYSADAKLTGLYVIKIYCFNCGGVCFSKSSECRLEYDLILFNSTSHLGKKTEVD